MLQQNNYPAKALRRNLVDSSGFTLAEIVVITALAALVIALVLPLFNEMDREAATARSDATLEEIRAAIVGPRGTLDSNGRPVTGGYVGDMGRLPKLYRSQWDGALGAWKWSVSDTVEKDGLNRPLNQPRGLWLEEWADMFQSGSANRENLRKEGPWNGPYLRAPIDSYGGDTRGYQWSSQGDHDGDNNEIRMRENEGRLSDGWGRAFLFWLDENATQSDAMDDTLWIVSEGPDHASAWTSAGDYPQSPSEVEAYDPKGLNEDNLVMKITRNEWHGHNVDVKIEKTQLLLQSIRKAITGSGIRDAENSLIPGGYTGDFGALPQLYACEWDPTSKRWEWDNAPHVYGLGDAHPWGQPRGLWRGEWQDEVSPVGQDVNLGSAWKGPYLPEPRDAYPVDTIHHDWAEEDDRDEIRMRETQGRLADEWGRALIFWNSGDPTTGTLWVVSEGPDRASAWQSEGGTPLWPGTANWDAVAENADNIAIGIAPSNWQ